MTERAQGVGVSLLPLTRADFASVAELATRIWREHYPSIITLAQIDYMLRARFDATALERYLASASRWFELVHRDGVRVGYCSYARGDSAGELRLEQLYLLAEQRGAGLGGHMLDHVQARARALGCQRVTLTVNKANRAAIAVYEARGFRVVAELRVDIGEGFVMDDFVMHKLL